MTIRTLACLAAGALVGAGLPAAAADGHYADRHYADGHYADGHYWVEQLRLDQAWRLSTGAGVTVGVLDTGVNAGHPNLAGAVLPGRAFPDLGQGVQDAWGHGTTVAMLIAGRGVDGATKGVAPGAAILPVTTSGTSDAVSEALHWLVDQGAGVINLSVGRARPSARSAAVLDEALAYAARHDVVVVAAAGNSGTDTGVTTPADRPGVVAVSAVDRTGRFRPDVSVSGPEVALAAPGVAIVTAGEAGVAGNDLSPDGTSYSAALVSGVIALARAAHPDESAAETVQRVLTTARPAGAEGRDPEYGYGVVDPPAALAAPPAVKADAPARRTAWWPHALGVPAAVLVLAGAVVVLRRRNRPRSGTAR
ncbi:S8 family serine peptidase [Actinoplanes subglobosus]|uniref:S8 family serine peptidase n=1 Tax=Actinoplanes subglobosus TaxID=1547892 RepID=A0ABV8IQ70_9ACTN